MIMTCRFNIPLVMFFLILWPAIFPVFGQEVENVDLAFERARELAFGGQRAEARALCDAILEISPDYHGVRILKARTYSWSGEYENARRELKTVLDRSPQHKDAYSALIDTELWSENYDEALDLAKQATGYHPLDESLLLKLATAYNYLDRRDEALNVLNQIESINPSNQEAAGFRRSIQASSQNYSLTASFTNDSFSEIFDAWNTGYVQLSRRTPVGSIIGRMNLASRFEETGIQPEIDFYPSIADGWYGYLNFGITSSSIFPSTRFGSEIFHRLPWGLEASLGLRHLRFTSSTVTIFTGSLTKYYGNWMFTGRPYMTPSDVGFSRSFSLLARKYFSDADNYVTLRGGFGFSPEERTYQLGVDDVFLIKSRFIGIDGYKSLRFNFLLFASADLTRQELRFDPGEYLTRITFNTGFVYRF